MRGEEERPELASYLIILGGVEEGIRARDASVAGLSR